MCIGPLASVSDVRHKALEEVNFLLNSIENVLILVKSLWNVIFEISEATAKPKKNQVTKTARVPLILLYIISCRDLVWCRSNKARLTHRTCLCRLAQHLHHPLSLFDFYLRKLIEADTIFRFPLSMCPVAVSSSAYADSHVLGAGKTQSIRAKLTKLWVSMIFPCRCQH